MKLEYAGDYHPHYTKGIPWRVIECGDSLIAAMGIGSPGGWSGMDYNVAQSAVTTATDFLCEAHDTSESTFHAAFARVRRMLREEFPYNHDTIDDIFIEENASTTLLTTIIQGAKIFLAWRGTEEAYHIRNNQIISRTYGHSFKTALRQHYPDMDVDADPRKTIWVKFLTASSEQTEPELLESPWQMQVGDYLVLTTLYIFEKLKDADLPHYVSGKPASEAYKTLIEASGESKWGQIAIVIRALED